MSVRVAADGWLTVPFAGSATDRCWLGFGQRQPQKWHPAFKRTEGRRRVLALPPPAALGSVVVWSKVNGFVRREGTVRLG